MEIKLKIPQLVVGLAILLGFTTKAQSPFYKVYSGNGYDKGEGIIQLVDSSYLITGSSSSFEDAPSQVFLLKLDKQGEYLWSRAYGGSEFEEGKRVMEVPGFGYYVVGTSSSGTSAAFDFYSFFTNLDGDVQWQNFTDNGGWERVHDAVLLPDTSFIAVGETDATSNGNSDLFMVRFSKLGAVVWTKQLGSSGDDVLKSIVLTSDSTFVVGGSYYNSDSLQAKGYVAKFHKDGTQLWDLQIGEIGNYAVNDLAFVNAEIKVVGERIQTGFTDKDIYQARVSGTGNYLYGEEFHADAEARYTSFVNYEAGLGDKYFVAVQSINPAIPTYADGEDVFVFRYNSGLYWDGYGEGYSGNGQDEVTDMVKTKDGYAAMVGFHTTYGPGGNSVFVVKIANESQFPVKPVNPTIENIVFLDEIGELQGVAVYPNPFEEQFTVSLLNQRFLMEIRSINGQLFLRQEAFETATVPTSEWSRGIYSVTISSEFGTATYKVVK